MQTCPWRIGRADWSERHVIVDLVHPASISQTRRAFLRSLAAVAAGAPLALLALAEPEAALAAAGDAAGLDAQSAYPTIAAGQNVHIYVRVKNTGSTTWRGGSGYGYKGTGSWASKWPGNALWHDVAPGATLTFEDTVTPSGVGTYNYGFLLTHSGATFGPSFFITVTVKAAQPALSLSLQANKTSAVANETVTLAATANRSLDGTGYFMVIRDGGGGRMASTSSGTSVSAGARASNATLNFSAVLSRDANGSTAILATSSTQVKWSAPVATIPTSASLPHIPTVVRQIWTNNSQKIDYRGVGAGRGTTGLNNCGPASVAMAIRYHNGDGAVSLDTVAKKMRGSNSDIIRQKVANGKFEADNGYTNHSDQNTRNWLSSAFGLGTDMLGSWDDVKRHIAAGHPVVIGVNGDKYVTNSLPFPSGWAAAHIVVIVAYDATNVYINDPLGWPNEAKRFGIKWNTFQTAVKAVSWNAMAVWKP
jgi:uncharacterized protein YvpB